MTRSGRDEVVLPACQTCRDRLTVRVAWTKASGTPQIRAEGAKFMPSRQVGERFDQPPTRTRSVEGRASVRESRRGGLGWVGIVGATLTSAIVLDISTALPQSFPTLYLIPVLVAAYHLRRQAVLIVGFIAIGSHLVMLPTAIQAESAQRFQLLAFAVTTWLAYRVSAQREMMSRHLADDRRATLTGDAARSDHLIVVAHELRTMVTALSGFIQLLRIREQYDDRLVATIARQGRRLERLGRDLSDVASPDSSPPDLERREVDIHVLADEVVEGARLAFRHHRFRLVASEEALVGWWDQGRLEQIFDNLISNAVKYSPDGGEVIVRLVRAGESIRLTVSDPGIGIPPQDIPFIFERFYRSQLTARVARGLGPVSMWCVDSSRRTVVTSASRQRWAEERHSSSSCPASPPVRRMTNAEYPGRSRCFRRATLRPPCSGSTARPQVARRPVRSWKGRERDEHDTDVPSDPTD